MEVRRVGDAGRQVAANIERLRKVRRIKYVDLVERLTLAGRRIPTLGLSRIEHHERSVDVDDLVAFGVVFGVEPWSLAAGPVELVCPQCGGRPPSGFICVVCGSRTEGV